MSSSFSGGSSDSGLREKYDVDDTAKLVNAGSFQKIALQFPDDQLSDAAAVVDALERQCGQADARFFVLGDTSSGSCCVDEIAAQHVHADLIVHYGHACLSPTGRLPVHYAVGRQRVNYDAVVDTLRRKLGGGRAVILYDLRYAAALTASEFVARLQADLPGTVLSFPALPLVPDVRSGPTGTSAPTSHGCACGPVVPPVSIGAPDAAPRGAACCGSSRSVEPDTLSGSAQHCCTCGGAAASGTCQSGAPTGGTSLGTTRAPADTSEAPASDSHQAMPWTWDESKVVAVGGGLVARLPLDASVNDYLRVYIGSHHPRITNLMIASAPAQFMTVDAESGDATEVGPQVQRLLRRRFYLMERARDATVFGIIAATLAVEGYREVIRGVKDAIAAAGRKAYVLAVGKLNPAKLANFAEVDCFVMVACAESTLIDSRDFFRPIVTPYELHLALSRTEAWTGTLMTDLRAVAETLARDRAAANDHAGASDHTETETALSLVTGRVRAFDLDSSEVSTDTSTLAAGSGAEIQVRRGPGSLIASGPASGAIVERFSARTFRGIEKHVHSDESESDSLAVRVGRTGIASKYDREDREQRGDSGGGS